MPDITALIMDDHDWLRRRFAELDDARDPQLCKALWDVLAEALQAHGRAEQLVVYPHLLKRACIDGDEAEMAAALHQRIRSAVAEAAAHEVHSAAWNDAVQLARTLNSKHLIIEEDGALADFRKHAPRRLRTRLGSEWQRFLAARGRAPLSAPRAAAKAAADAAAADATDHRGVDEAALQRESLVP